MMMNQPQLRNNMIRYSGNRMMTKKEGWKNTITTTTTTTTKKLHDDPRGAIHQHDTTIYNDRIQYLSRFLSSTSSFSFSNLQNRNMMTTTTSACRSTTTDPSCHYRFRYYSTSSSNKTTTTTPTTPKNKFSSSSAAVSSSSESSSSSSFIKFLDLRGSGLSILERLCLEECIYQTDIHHHWFIIGTHEPTNHRYFHTHHKNHQKNNNNDNKSPKPIYSTYNNSNNNANTNITSSISTDESHMDDITTTTQEKNNNNKKNSNDVAIVLGLGGKPNELLHVQSVRDDSICCIKRFTGGGTVVLDTDSIYTTIIGRHNQHNQQEQQDQDQQQQEKQQPNQNDNHEEKNHKKQPSLLSFYPRYTNNKSNEGTNETTTTTTFYPRPIMEWTAEFIYEPLFQKLNEKQQQQQLEQQLQQQELDRHGSNNSIRSRTPYPHDDMLLQKTLVMETKSCGVADYGSGRSVSLPQRRQEQVQQEHDVSVHGKPLPQFQLLENDYVLAFSNNILYQQQQQSTTIIPNNNNDNNSNNSKNSTTSSTETSTDTTTTTGTTATLTDTTDSDSFIYKKMGGNAQAIGKNGFIHHTSFLWNYQQQNMNGYLQPLPKKRPQYRQNRSHTEFVTTLHSIYTNLSKDIFHRTLYEIIQKEWGTTTINNNKNSTNDGVNISNNSHTTTTDGMVVVEKVTLRHALDIVRTATNGGTLQDWYEQKSRNLVLTNL